MINQKHDDFDDGLEGLFNGQVTKREPAAPAAPYAGPQGFTTVTQGKRQDYVDRCDKCRGSGNFVGYTGRVLGPCFKCKGTGKLVFKTTPAERATAKAQRDDRKVRKASDLQAKAIAWQQAHPAAAEWLNSNVSNSFAMSLMDALTKFGSLTDGQLAAIERNIAQATERKIANTSEMDVSKISEAFQKARDNAADDGDFVRNLKLRFDGFSFSPDKRNPAVIWVNSDSQLNDRGLPAALGKVEGGAFTKFRICTDDVRDQIAEVARDPGAAAKAYGLRFKFCCACGRELTNVESREAGIGPICATKYDF